MAQSPSRGLSRDIGKSRNRKGSAGAGGSAHQESGKLVLAVGEDVVALHHVEPSTRLSERPDGVEQSQREVMVGPAGSFGI